jgi:hypothetical protein
VKTRVAKAGHCGKSIARARGRLVSCVDLERMHKVNTNDASKPLERKIAKMKRVPTVGSPLALRWGEILRVQTACSTHYCMGWKVPQTHVQTIKTPECKDHSQRFCVDNCRR